MTPLSTLEGMASAEGHSALVEWIDWEFWEDAKVLLKTAVHFDFRMGAPLAEHVDWGAELFDKGVFRLPFTTVYYTSPALPDAAMVARYDKATGPMAQELTILIFDYMPKMDRMREGPSASLRFWGSSWEEAQCQLRHWCHLPDGIDPFWQAPRMPLKDFLKWEEWGPDDVKRHPVTASLPMEGQRTLIKAIPFVMGATAMLASKDVEQQIERPSTRLNEKRARRGEQPLPERRIVTVRLHARAAYEQAMEDHKAGRMSVRMHLRRGHFRTIYQGTEKERVIPVAPCVVNAGEGGEAIAKAYRVHGNKVEAQS
jgi:hypothetical protein